MYEVMHMGMIVVVTCSASLIKSDKLKIDTTYTTFKVKCEPLLRNLLENVQILSGVQIWLNRFGR